jgi:hypothetical protein
LSAPGPSRKTIFVHIPKNGGQAFEAVLRGLYWQTPYVFFADVAAAHNPNRSRRDLILPIAEFEKFTAPELTERFTAIWGHIPFLKYQSAFSGEDCSKWNFVTVLRNPIEGYISLYSYLRRHKEESLREMAADIGLVEFLKKRHVHNRQCMFATGQPTFEKARTVLEARYTGFCVLEDLYEFSGIYGDFVDGALKRPVTRTNTSSSHELLSQLSADDLGWLIEHVRDDYLLVEWARSAWRDHMRKAMTARGFNFDEEAAARLRLGDWSEETESERV